MKTKNDRICFCSDRWRSDFVRGSKTRPGRRRKPEDSRIFVDRRRSSPNSRRIFLSERKSSNSVFSVEWPLRRDRNSFSERSKTNEKRRNDHRNSTKTDRTNFRENPRRKTENFSEETKINIQQQSLFVFFEQKAQADRRESDRREKSRRNVRSDRRKQKIRRFFIERRRKTDLHRSIPRSTRNEHVLQARELRRSVHSARGLFERNSPSNFPFRFIDSTKTIFRNHSRHFVFHRKLQ